MPRLSQLTHGQIFHHAGILVLKPNRERRPADIEEEKRQAWNDLGWGLLWSLVLLAAIVASIVVAGAFEHMLPAGAAALIFIIGLAAVLQLVFLYPAIFAVGRLLKIYVGRFLWRYAAIRWLGRLVLVMFAIAVIYQIATDRSLLDFLTK